MNREKKETLKEIEPVFHQVFSNKKLKITYDTSPNTIKQWDSLAQINLFIGIEKLLNIKFNVSELAKPKNVGEMIDIIISKKK
tara:strand:- start:327 stop:575 length:249 start_codon:yes stop_codon:yes gene_type:complete